MAKTKLSELNEANGKVEKFEPTTLDEVWGENQNSRYGTTDEAEYEAQLREMDTLALQKHAKANGIMARTTNTEMLRHKLTQIFKQHVAKYRKPKLPEGQASGVSKKQLAETMKILAEGK